MSGLPSRVVVVGLRDHRQGNHVPYRTVKGNLDTGNAVITLRHVAKGTRGTLTFLVKIVVEPATTTSRWTITSGTRA